MLEPPVRIADPVRRRRVVLIVAFILLISAALRLWQVATPDKYMFDEVYYAKDAKTIVDGRVHAKPPFLWEGGDEVSWPHPEMGKFAIATGILVFGDRAFGWRIPAVIAGMVMLGFVYPLARRLGLPPPWAIIALSFAAADPLGIAQSRIATLDIFLGVWSVLCVFCALRYVQDGRRRRWLIMTAVTGGMASATKWSGGLALIAAGLLFVLAWYLDRRRERSAGRQAALEDGADFCDDDAEARDGAAPDGAGVSGAKTVAQAIPGALLAAAALILIPAALYMLSYTQYFVVGHSLSQWVELQRQAVWFNLHLKATHTYASIAPSWIIDYRPVWYYFVAGPTDRGVVAIGNPFLWWTATLCLVAAPVLALLRRTTLLLPAAIVVAVLYFPWFAATRTSFLYYMTPVAPFMAILAAAGLLAFAGTAVIASREIWVMALAALLTAVLWDPVGRAAGWLFWTRPASVSPTLGWIGAGVGIFLVAFVAIVLLSPRARVWRPLTAMVLAGAIVGIVVAFLPIVLNIPISAGHFYHIMWFRNWI